MERTVLYASSYTNASPVGIRVFDASDPDGRLSEMAHVEEVEHPSFIAPHPHLPVLYAVSETGSLGGEPGGLVAFRIEPGDGGLTVLDTTSSHGAAPCYLSLSEDGRHIYVANYGSGTIALYEVRSDGSFGDVVDRRQLQGRGPSPRQDGPHAHCVLPGPGTDSVYTVDLGSDRVVRHVHRGNGAVLEFGDELIVPAGTGPRHLAFHPEYPVAFLVGELNSSLTVVECDAATGRLQPIGVCSTLPDGVDANSLGAEVRVHPRGHRVYVSNRGHDSIAVYAFSSPADPLVLLGHVDSGGRTPRGFAVHPRGRALVVANQDSHEIVPFVIDPVTGVPQKLDAAYGASEPVCLAFVEVDR